MSSNATLLKRASEMILEPAKKNRMINTMPADWSLVKPLALLMQPTAVSSNKMKLFRQWMKTHMGKLLQQSDAIASYLALSIVSTGGQALQYMTQPAASSSAPLNTTSQVVPTLSVIRFQLQFCSIILMNLSVQILRHRVLNSLVDPNQIFELQRPKVQRHLPFNHPPQRKNTQTEILPVPISGASRNVLICLCCIHHCKGSLWESW